MAEWFESAPVASGNWWEAAPIYKPPKPGVVEDVTRTVPAGLARGAAGLAGLTTDLGTFFEKGVDTVSRWARGETPEQQDERVDRNFRAIMTWLGAPDPGPREKIMVGPDPLSSEGIRQGIETVTGPLYKPQTAVGEYVNTAAEFAPAALMGPGGAVARTAQVVVPAVASETAGQVTRRVAPGAEPAARVAGAVTGGLATAVAQTPRTARAAIARHMGGIDDAAITAARQLMDDAAAQGVALTWPEAIAQVTANATSLTSLQRVAEQSAGGSNVLKPFMAERPGQVQRAGETAIAQLADTPMDPTVTGPAVRRAAEAEIAGAQTAVNAATRPLYQAAERQSVTPQVAQALAANPIYAATLHEVRNNPALNATIANLPDDAVAVVNMVQRRMREAAETARVPGQATTSNTAAMNIEAARAPAIEAAEQATGGRMGDYAQARAAQERLRREFLEPLTEGPTGKLAATPDVMAQARALLPNQPAAGIDAAVSQTVRRVARQNPDAAQNLVRTYAQTVFDEAIQNNLSGPNQFGGAKFAAVIAGNPQQARNLEAAVRALPNGNTRWEGFRRFLDIMEATGQRQPAGSQTAFNQAIQDELRRGGIVGETVSAAATGGLKIPARLTKWYEELRLGRNTEQLARIFTDPAAEPLLRQLARATPGSPRAQALALRLTYISDQAGRPSE